MSVEWIVILTLFISLQNFYKFNNEVVGMSWIGLILSLDADEIFRDERLILLNEVTY